MAPEEIMAQIVAINRRYPSSWVCLTGGEPLLQEIKPLARAIKKAGFRLQIETNATLKPTVGADWWSISPKPPDYSFHPDFIKKAKEVKLVVTRGLSLKTILHLRSLFPAATPIILQPQSGRRWSEKKALSLLRICQKSGVNNIRFSLQLHRLLQIP